MPDYTPEITLGELRDARDNRPECAALAGIMQRASVIAAGAHWPSPRDREQAGLGCVVAAATLTEHGTGESALMLTAVGMFGLALVESARNEMAERIASHCHEVRDGDTIPCSARPGEPHVDAEGREYVTVPLARKEASRGR